MTRDYLIEEHTSILEEGVEAWNAWRRSNRILMPLLIGADLSGRDLRRVDLSNADLSVANLSGANLSEGRLYQSEFYKANLREACLKNCDMRGAKLHFADLSSADLSSADLYRADFIRSKLALANMINARCDTTAFSQVDLSEVQNLDKVVHSGSSSIDLASLKSLVNDLPVAFLGGVGIQRSVIDYLPYLLENAAPVQYHSCFISYSHHDEEFARCLFERLRKAQVQVWFAPESIKRGRKLREQIDEAIHLHDKLLLVLSRYSLESNWVVTEIKKALRRERDEHRRMLFPLSLIRFDELQGWECFDADWGKDIAVEVREYFIPDFSAWRDPAVFEEAVQELIRDLRPT